MSRQLVTDGFYQKGGVYSLIIKGQGWWTTKFEDSFRYRTFGWTLYSDSEHLHFLVPLGYIL